jgi:hypothetical protein
MRMSEALIDPYFLKSERLGFRCWSLEDYPLARELWGDMRVPRFFGGRSPTRKCGWSARSNG